MHLNSPPVEGCPKGGVVRSEHTPVRKPPSVIPLTLSFRTLWEACSASHFARCFLSLQMSRYLLSHHIALLQAVPLPRFFRHRRRSAPSLALALRRFARHQRSFKATYCWQNPRAHLYNTLSSMYETCHYAVGVDAHIPQSGIVAQLAIATHRSVPSSPSASLSPPMAAVGSVTTRSIIILAAGR